jgi:hypothetical protein
VPETLEEGFGSGWVLGEGCACIQIAYRHEGLRDETIPVGEFIAQAVGLQCMHLKAGHFSQVLYHRN